MSENKSDRMPYQLYYYRQRLLIENIDGHVINLGGVEHRSDRLLWQLDGKDAAGETPNDTEALFDDVTSALSFLFVDGQFTSLPDVSAEYGDRLDNAPSRELVLTELNDRDEQRVR
ncbi:hypothetical protein [Pantoea sp.]|uniref:hypothetical protein n=1 Tax=Pantoea sp. TaxID=69393 RepID=UPI0031DD13A9